MKNLRKIVILFLLLLWLTVPVIPVAATTVMEHQGLNVTVEMDKEQYDEGEPITATITVTNTNGYPVTVVNLEQLIPEGYVLSENSQVAISNFEIKAGETAVLTVTMEAQPTQAEVEETSGSFFDKLLYGESFGIPNLLLAVLAVIAFIIFMLLT